MKLYDLTTLILVGALLLLSIHTYVKEKFVLKALEEGKPIICRGTILEKAQIKRFGDKLYVVSGPLIFPVETCKEIEKKEKLEF